MRVLAVARSSRCSYALRSCVHAPHERSRARSSPDFVVRSRGLLNALTRSRPCPRASHPRMTLSTCSPSRSTRSRRAGRLRALAARHRRGWSSVRRRAANIGRLLLARGGRIRRRIGSSGDRRWRRRGLSLRRHADHGRGRQLTDPPYLLRCRQDARGDRRGGATRRSSSSAGSLRPRRAVLCRASRLDWASANALVPDHGMVRAAPRFRR